MLVFMLVFVKHCYKDKFKKLFLHFYFNRNDNMTQHKNVDLQSFSNIYVRHDCMLVHQQIFCPKSYGRWYKCCSVFH